MALHIFNTGLASIISILADQNKEMLSAVSETFTAIYRLIQTWFEGNLGILAALCADSVVHLSFSLYRTISAELGLSSRPAFLAPSRFILEASGRIKFLFPRGKNEFLPTVFAH